MHSVGLHAVHGRQHTTVLAIHAHFLDKLACREHKSFNQDEFAQNWSLKLPVSYSTADCSGSGVSAPDPHFWGFPLAGHRTLESHLRLMQSADTFRRHLKTFLFHQAFLS